jgi:hypothetical protein
MVHAYNPTYIGSKGLQLKISSAKMLVRQTRPYLRIQDACGSSRLKSTVSGKSETVSEK